MLCTQPVRRLRTTGDSQTLQEATAYGVFANAAIHFGKLVDLTLGARESYDEKEFSNELFASDNFVPQFGGSTTVTAKDDWDATDYRATVDFNITDDVMLYVTSSKAFRSGTFSVPAPVAVTGQPYQIRPQPALVPPETLYNDEIGIRTEWLDGRLRFNATYYDMDFTDRQGASAVADATSPTGFRIDLVNQGDVDLWGNEFEASFAVTDRFTVEGATGRANYEMANPCINNGPYLFPPPMDREYNVAGRYNWPTERSGSFDFTLSYTKTGPMQTHPGGFTPEELAQVTCFATPAAAVFPSTFIDSRYEVPSYNLANFSMRFTLMNEADDDVVRQQLDRRVYANNAQSFGRGFWTAGGPGGAVGYSAAPRQAIADYRGRPREYGLTFQFNFR
jgi:outer membrane receptor protein involved in Fe transport